MKRIAARWRVAGAVRRPGAAAFLLAVALFVCPAVLKGQPSLAVGIPRLADTLTVRFGDTVRVEWQRSQSLRPKAWGRQVTYTLLLTFDNPAENPVIEARVITTDPRVSLPPGAGVAQWPGFPRQSVLYSRGRLPNPDTAVFGFSSGLPIGQIEAAAFLVRFSDLSVGTVAFPTELRHTDGSTTVFDGPPRSANAAPTIRIERVSPVPPAFGVVAGVATLLGLTFMALRQRRQA